MNVLMIGAGEYTAGFVQTKDGAATDKPAGVIAITLFDLRRLGKVSRMVMCDAGGSKFPAIRDTMKAKIGDVYKDMDITLETYPADGSPFDPIGYKGAIALMSAGDVATIFTPDDTHFDIAMACVASGLHVLIAKPVVKNLEHHRILQAAAKEKGVLVAVEYHKRWDPLYADAKDRVQSLLPFSFFSSTMTQPKKQLDTFAGWAGKSSDISYYLNSHHIDIHAWAVGQTARPVQVTAIASTGVAEKRLANGTKAEDTITLLVQWQNTDESLGTAVYTASWIAPTSDCHTQQYFHFMGQKGEVRVDQAHRGYTQSTDRDGFATLNPLYMKYVPDASGRFAGQQGYGYRSIADFIDAVRRLRLGEISLADIEAENKLATLAQTVVVTAILEAGRKSLDEGGRAVKINYDNYGGLVSISAHTWSYEPVNHAL